MDKGKIRNIIIIVVIVILIGAGGALYWYLTKPIKKWWYMKIEDVSVKCESSFLYIYKDKTYAIVAPGENQDEVLETGTIKTSLDIVEMGKKQKDYGVDTAGLLNYMITYSDGTHKQVSKIESKELESIVYSIDSDNMFCMKSKNGEWIKVR